MTQETHKEVKHGQLCNEAIKLKRESCHMVEDQENRNDEYIFKKPTTLRVFKKNKNEGINKPNQETKGKVVRMDTDNNTEEVTILKDVSNYELLNDLDKFDIENMPLIFDSEFDVVKEIEVVTPQIEKEYTKREIINAKEKLDVVDISLKNTTSNIKVTSIENFNNKNVIIDISQYRKRYL